MEENNQSKDTAPQTQTSTENSDDKGSGGKIAAIIAGLLIIIIIGMLYINRSAVSKLTSQLTQTQGELEDIQDEKSEAVGEVTGEIKEGISQIAEEITDLDSPLARFMLTKAYADKIRSVLSNAGKENLDTVIVYVEKTPAVLVQKNPTLPEEVADALSKVKSEIASLKTGAVATSLSSEDAQTGETVTITGVLEFVSDDAILGGSVFKLTTAEEVEYYLHLNAANSTTAKNLDGEEVEITVEITGTENGLVSYDVLSGPTKVAEEPTSTPTL